jgi:signal transduction histidine kinase
MHDDATRILVVDDDEASLSWKGRILRASGYQVLEATTGRQALAIIEAERPDLVVLDVKLPDADGLEICRKLRDEGSTILVLQISATYARDQDLAGLDSGADAYLTEPLERDVLVGTIRSLLRLRAAENDLRRLNETLEQRVAERTRELANANEKLLREIAERRKAEAALLQAQKMEAIGHLTGSIAHDFNNLLTVIIANLARIGASLDDRVEIPSTKLRRLISNSEQAAELGAQLTTRLLAFARRQVLQAVSLDVNRTIAEFRIFLRRAVGEAISLQTDLAAGLWTCRLDPSQFEAALLNLTVNARDAMPAGGTLTVGTENVTIERPQATRGGAIEPGEYVRVTVSDTGHGMSRETLERAVEPFFTTKPVGKGSGLGLSQVYGFATQSGGTIDIESTAGAGTTFSLYFPRTTDRIMTEADPALAQTDKPGRGETILVVEDNDLVLDTVVSLLGELGYRVLIATDAQQALDLIARGARIDLLFSDIVLPNGLSGMELAEKIRARQPNLRILLTTGFSAEAAKLGTRFTVLPKPYRRADLADRLREALGPR